MFISASCEEKSCYCVVSEGDCLSNYERATVEYNGLRIAKELGRGEKEHYHHKKNHETYKQINNEFVVLKLKGIGRAVP